MSDLLRPIIGIENRTAQEVFDIMCDRISSRLRSTPAGVTVGEERALRDEIERLTKERDQALEAEDEAKDCFWAVYPRYLESGGEPISTEAARTTLADRADALQAKLDEAKAVLADAVDHYDRNVCAHESVHRGGAIWTICDECGAKWADDQGGFVPYSDPPGIVRARDFLSALSPTGTSGGGNG